MACVLMNAGCCLSASRLRWVDSSALQRRMHVRALSSNDEDEQTSKKKKASPRKKKTSTDETPLRKTRRKKPDAEPEVQVSDKLKASRDEPSAEKAIDMPSEVQAAGDSNESAVEETPSDLLLEPSITPTVAPDETLWKKPFPWLGREFEETFVKPRNEPNPLVCCFGEAMEDFIPTVRVCPVQMDPDSYSSWKGLQWVPPEFARSPGTTAVNVAISLARLKGNVAFIGKVGNDERGKHFLDLLKSNKVETKGVVCDHLLSTSVSQVDLVRHEKRKISMVCAQQSAENCLDVDEVDVDILKEARVFHFSSLSLTTESMGKTLLSALETAQSAGSIVFFDVNLPLPLWTSPEETWATIEKAWNKSDVIKINKVELEYLIADEGLALRILDTDQPSRDLDEYLARRDERFEYHYTLEHIAPLWRDNIKMLLVTDGTWRIHYYTPQFHGDVVGTEDVIVAAHSCDRTGSGDTISAAIIRKLAAQPYILDDQEKLEKALRFAISAGVISQWTMGAVRGFPTESAAQNLTEQMFAFTQI